MTWIPSHRYMGEHPKTRRLARCLGLSIPQVVGHMHLLWHWCMSFAQDGDLTKYDHEDIAFGMMWDGEPDILVEALVASGFLDAVDGRLTVHNWDEYGGKRLRSMQNDAARKRNARKREAEKASGRQPPVQCVADEKPAPPRTSAGCRDDKQAEPEVPESVACLDAEADAFFSALMTSAGRDADIRVQRRVEEKRVQESTGENSVARDRACDARLPPGRSP